MGSDDGVKTTVEVDWSPGMVVEVEYIDEYPTSGPGGWETERVKLVGRVTNVPGRVFDRPDDPEHDFDFEGLDGAGSPKWSANLDTNRVHRLMYDAGGDRDYASYPLARVTVTDTP